MSRFSFLPAFFYGLGLGMLSRSEGDVRWYNGVVLLSVGVIIQLGLLVLRRRAASRP